MKKLFLHLLLCGALILSTGTFVSCNDTSDLENRITVLEGLVRELNTAVAAGETIRTAVENADGSWTLTLSGGRVITTGTGGGGGGANVNVVQSDGYITITIGDDSWTLPLGPGFRSLVYVPEFADGEVRLDDFGRANVRFLARPALSDAQVASADFAIASANALATRSYVSLFDIDGTVTVAGNYITVPIQAMGGEGRTFGVAVSMTLNGGVYVSNFFNVVVPATLQGLPEDLTTPTLVAAVTDLTPLGNGIYTATLPSTTAFLAGMNFADLFTGLPAGATFRVGPPAEQNDNVLYGTRLATLRNSLAENGEFELTERLGHDLMSSDPAEEPNGFLVNVIYNNTIIHKIYWQIYDPIAALDFTSTAIGRADMEWGYGAGDKWLVPGHIEPIQYIDFNALIAAEMEFISGAGPYQYLVGDTRFLFHGNSRNIFPGLRTYSVSSPEGIVMHFDGERMALGPVGEALLGPGSRGVVWSARSMTLVASYHRNPQPVQIPPSRPASPGTIAGWNYLENDPVALAAAPLGVTLTTDGRFLTNENFGGHGWRLDVRVQFEYAFGYRWVRDTYADLFRLFINRRAADPSVVYPAPRT